MNTNNAAMPMRESLVLVMSRAIPTKVYPAIKSRGSKGYNFME